MAAQVLEWNDRLATGLDEVDVQHHRLIDIINSLGMQRHGKAGLAELRRVLDELRNYTTYHFQTEADLMQTWPVNAAHRDAHLKAHQGFIERVEKAGELISTNPSDVVDHLLAFLMKWLAHHITGVDARMAREIQALQTGSAVSDVAKEGQDDSLLDTVSELYDSIGARTFEMLELNHRLQVELERRRQTEQELRLAATVYHTVDEAILVSDANNNIVAVNPAFSRVTGYAAAEVIGRNPRMLASGGQGPEFYREMWDSLHATGSWKGEIWNRRKSGETYIEWLSIKQVRDERNQPTHYVAAFSDITERKASDERIRHLAHFDALTDLPNRTLFFDRVQQALAKALRDNSGTAHLALFYLDLDKFKSVNDTLGHAAGDLLLQEAAKRMQACVRASDTVARLGGDEFALLLPAIEHAHDALLVAEKIRERLAAPFYLCGNRIDISSSIGIAVFPEHGREEEQLVKAADNAMYRAKSRGRNKVEFFGPASAAETIDR